MSTAFQRTFGHLVTANAVLNGDPPPLAPSTNPSSSSQPTPPPPTDTSIKIIQGRTLTSKSLLNAGFRYSRDGNPLTDGRQAWRCVKRSCKYPGRLFTLNDSFHSLGKPHTHPADAADYNSAEAHEHDSLRRLGTRQIEWRLGWAGPTTSASPSTRPSLM